MAVYARRIQAQNRMTVMLLSISTVFVLSNILEPFIHASIYSTLFGECSLESADYETFRMFGNLFEVGIRIRAPNPRTSWFCRSLRPRSRSRGTWSWANQPSDFARGWVRTSI